VGRILFHVDPATAQKFVVELYSRRLSASLRKYETHKPELLALVVCPQHWRHDILGAPGGITIINDHEPLLTIKTTKSPSRMFLRWAHFIQLCSFKVQCRPGKDNPPDLISRQPDRLNAGEMGITVGELDSDLDDASPTLIVLSCHSMGATLAPSDLDANTEHGLTTHVLSRVRAATACDPLLKAIRARHTFQSAQRSDYLHHARIFPRHYTPCYGIET
jgi:hypothetical protein